MCGVSSRTLWEEGRLPGSRVATAATAATLIAAGIDVRLDDHVTILFDVAFVLVAVAAALAVRPRDFFVTGVLPPLMLLTVVLLLALVRRTAVADPGDDVVQAAVSGLAHHAKALVTGYVLTLAVLVIRQATVRKRRRQARESAAGRTPYPKGAARKAS